MNQPDTELVAKTGAATAWALWLGWMHVDGLLGSRTGLVRALGVPDQPIALLEDAVTVAASLWVVRHVQ